MKKVIQVRLDNKDIDRLKKEAERSGHSVSSFARQVIKTHMDKLKADK